MSKRAAAIVTKEWIRKKANGLRKYLGFPPTGFIDPLSVLDRLANMPLDKSGKLFGDYEIVPDRTHFIPDGNAAYTDLDQKKIYIRERAIKQFAMHKYGREAFDVYHEIGHLVLHCITKDAIRIVADNYSYRSEMEDPERQADIFAAEFFVPLDDARRKTYDEILRDYRCSIAVAKLRAKEATAT